MLVVFSLQAEKSSLILVSYLFCHNFPPLSTNLLLTAIFPFPSKPQAAIPLEGHFDLLDEI